jgi:hypothetical protein
LVVTGLDALNGYTLPKGSSFPLVTASSGGGTFSSFTLPPAAGAEHLVYNNGNVTLQVSST